MFYALKDKFNRIRFQRSSQAILKTPPLALHSGSQMAVLSQLRHKDILMYLIAIKSFARQVPVGMVHVLSDGTLTAEDGHLLRRHVPGVKIRTIKDVALGKCPSGGTWERLLSIADLTAEHYVVQLDADTLTLDKIPEIAECVSNNQSFTISTWDNQAFEPMAQRQREAVRLITGNSKSHIQLFAEANFDQLRDFSELRYIRGCSGFAGFAKNGNSRAFIEDISGQMTVALGERWREWGTEQVMSNIVVANSSSARALPHPKYCDCTKINLAHTRFIHFIGPCRFKGGVYAKMAGRTIASIKSP